MAWRPLRWDERETLKGITRVFKGPQGGHHACGRDGQQKRPESQAATQGPCCG